MKLVDSKNIVIIATWCILFVFLGYALSYQATQTLQDTSGFDNNSYRYSGFLMLLFLTIFVYKNKKNINCRTQIYKPLILFSVFMAIGVILTSSDLFSLYGLFNVASLTLIPYLAYAFGSIIVKKCEEEILEWMVFIGVLYLSYCYFSVYQLAMLSFSSAVIWVATYPLTLLPLQTTFQNKYLKIIAIIIVFSAVITCTKRSAAIALIGGLLLYYVLQRKIKGVGILKMLLFMGIILIIFYFGVEYLDQFSEFNTLERLSQIEEDKGNGREEIYMKILSKFGDSNIINQLFGHGHQAVLKINYTTAHNDFLEVLYDYGLLTFIPYLIMHIRLYKTCVDLIRIKSKYAPTLCFSALIFLVFSMISHVILYPTYILTTLTWGMVLGMEENR